MISAVDGGRVAAGGGLWPEPPDERVPTLFTVAGFAAGVAVGVVVVWRLAARFRWEA